MYPAPKPSWLPSKLHYGVKECNRRSRGAVVGYPGKIISCKNVRKMLPCSLVVKLKVLLHLCLDDLVPEKGEATLEAVVRSSLSPVRGDWDIMIKAVFQNATLLEYATDEVRGDREIVMRAVSKRGQSLKYASEKLKDDHDVVMKAVSNDWWALKHASQEHYALKNAVML